MKKKLFLGLLIFKIALFFSVPALAQSSFQTQNCKTCTGGVASFIGGDATCQGNLAVNGTLTVAGAQTFTGNMAVTGTLTVTGQSNLNGGWQIGTGATVTKTLVNSATIDFTAKTSACEDSNAITVTGAVASDPCMVGAPAGAVTAQESYTCYVSASDAVKVHHCAVGTGADVPSGSYTVMVFHAS